MDPSRGKNSNCRDDGGIYWDIFNQVDFSKISPVDVQLESDPKEAPDQALPKSQHVHQETHEEYVLADNHGDVKYGSYMSRRLIQNVDLCVICVGAFSLQKEERGEQHSILTLTEDPASDYSFVACTPRVQRIVHRATQNFIQVLQNNFAKLDLGARLAKAIRSTRDFEFLETSCGIHSKVNPNFMVKVMIRSLQRFLLKQENRKLTAPLEKSRGLAKIASLATSSQKIGRLFSTVVIFSKKPVKVARPLSM
jgi:hypothetical protein